MSSFGDRLFQEAKEREERKKERINQQKFSFSPKLVATRPGENVVTERINRSNTSNRLFNLSLQEETKRKDREKRRKRNELQNCTFEPAVSKKLNRPTRPIVQSSPAAFKRKVKHIFQQLDIDSSGSLSLKELKRGIIHVPELSEIITPGRSKSAFDELSKSAKIDEVTFVQFQSFCENATSLNHLNTFERKVNFIFEQMDINDNGSISSKELKRGIIHIPELSELIAPKRFQLALKQLTPSTSNSTSTDAGGGMTKIDFLLFCKKAASINHVANTPERRSARMYQRAKETLENKDRSRILQKEKLAKDLDVECTFIPITNKPNKLSASTSPSSRFDQLYNVGVHQRKKMDEKAIETRKEQELKIYKACSFSPKIIHYTANTNANFQPTPPKKGQPSTKNAIDASNRLYKQAISRQQRVEKRETRRKRLEGDQCTFHPVITELGHESKGKKE